MKQVKRILVKILHRHKKLVIAGKMPEGTRHYTWFPYLNHALYNLNNRVNRITDLTATQGRNPDNYETMFERLYGPWKWEKIAKRKSSRILHIHDKVRLQIFYRNRNFHPYARSLEPSWSEEVYEIGRLVDQIWGRSISTHFFKPC